MEMPSDSLKCSIKAICALPDGQQYQVAMGHVAVALGNTSESHLVLARKFQLQHICMGLVHHQGDMFISSGTALFKYPLSGKQIVIQSLLSQDKDDEDEVDKNYLIRRYSANHGRPSRLAVVKTVLRSKGVARLRLVTVQKLYRVTRLRLVTVLKLRLRSFLEVTLIRPGKNQRVVKLLPYDKVLARLFGGFEESLLYD
ncbi:hypothetical protein DPMN_175056 [Dreissena polymorpha]|uniref:Uncharacterized protein n=1 Tax=Dreissena polymorpha TaxID=45954 RepID=A0A9D4IJ70_DREPO|nr:hypothetical protein DPMN_175056 [Dreissena polymorpha]